MPMQWEEPVRAAIYVRVSSDSQDVNNSVEAQLAECRRYAQDHSMAVVKTYVDEAESGRTGDRPRFQQMMADAQDPQRPFTVILIWKFSRFSRDKFDNAVYKNRLKRHGVRLVSIKEPVDTGPAGEMMEGIIESMDAFYSANLSQEVRRGQRQVAERGYYPGRKAPFGYRIEKVKEPNGNAVHNTFALDPPHDATVRRIFGEAIAGRSHHEIRAGLIRDGIPSPKGGKWAASSIHDILHDRQYAGYIVWGVSSKSGEPPIVKAGCHPAIVSQGEFEQAALALAARAKAVINPRQAGSDYMLSGLLRCRMCGNSMIVRPARKGRYRYYMCRTRRHDGQAGCEAPTLNVKALEDRFLEAVIGDLLREDNIRAAIGRIAEELTGPYEEQTARLESVGEELRRVEEQQDRIMTAYERGAYTVEDFLRP